MKSKKLRFGVGFQVAFSSKKAQAVVMTLAPDQSEGGPENNHRGVDQWLFVHQGSGVAIVNGKRHVLKRGTLLLIEKGKTTK